MYIDLTNSFLTKQYYDHITSYNTQSIIKESTKIYLIKLPPNFKAFLNNHLMRLSNFTLVRRKYYFKQNQVLFLRNLSILH